MADATRQSSYYDVTPFEHYMLADDRPGYSMMCHARFWFRGNFGRDSFADALHRAALRHPLLRSIIEGDARSRTTELRWCEAAKFERPELDWASFHEPVTGDVNPDTLRARSALKVFVREKPGQTVVVVRFHHTNCDGAGLFAFVEDLLCAYEHERGLVPEPRWAVRESARLIGRGMYGFDPIRLRQRRWQDLWRTAMFFRRAPEPLVSPRSATEPRDTSPSLLASCRHVLAADVLEGLRGTARSAKVTVNDLLLRDLFATAAAWNGRHGGNSQRLSLAMPMDMRLPEHQQTPATNIVSLVFLIRGERLVRDEDALLTSISDETAEFKRQRLGIVMIRILRRLGSVRGGLVRFFGMRRCQATAVLTNLGRPFAASPLLNRAGLIEVGGVVLEDLETLPPVRELTRAAVSVNYYAGRLSLTLRYDSSALSRAEAEDLLGAYCAKLMQSAAMKKATLAAAS